MKKTIFTILMAMVAGAGWAQTVTVAPSGADFTSLKAAVDSFNSGGSNNGNSAPNVINITVGTVYEETASIVLSESDDWTIRCTDASSSATLVIPADHPGTEEEQEKYGLIQTADSISPFDDGINGSVTIENIILLPASAAGTGVRTVLTKALQFENASATVSSAADVLSVTLRKVLISANNGSNQPVSDGTFAASGGYTAISSDGLRMLSGVNGLLLEDVTITHVGGSAVSDNGDILTGIATERKISKNCRFSYNYQNGYLLSGGDLSGVIGTEQEPVWIQGNRGSGFVLGSSVNDLGSFEYVRIIGNSDPGNDVSASGLHFVGTKMMDGAEFYKCFIAENGSSTDTVRLNYGNISANNSQNTTVTFRECTIFDAALDKPTFVQLNNSTGDMNFVFVDCVIAGRGGEGDEDFIRSSEATATVTFDHSAIVTSGPYSLDVGRAADAATATSYSGTGTGFIFTNLVSADPNFVSTDPASDSYLDVQSNAYAGVSSTGGNLSGAGDWIPMPNQARGAWTLY